MTTDDDGRLDPWTPTDATTLALFTIYRSPSDHPGVFVVRRWTIRGGKAVPDPGHVLAPGLDEARACLPPGLHNLGRQPDDDPVIEETWI